jgi:hypothetical protein
MSLYDQFTVLPPSNSTEPFNPQQPIFIHIGAGFYGRYELEKLGHRDGYIALDVRNEPAPIQKRFQSFSAIDQDHNAQQTMQESERGYPIIDEGSPEIIVTGIEVEEVIKDVKKEVKNLVSIVMALNSTDSG